MSPRRDLVLPGLAVGLAVLVLSWNAAFGGSAGNPNTLPATTGHSGHSATVTTAPTGPQTGWKVRVRPAGTLTRSVQNAAAAPSGGSAAVLLGGLTPADISTDAITVVEPGGSRAIGRLPGRLHDAAATPLNGAVYLFGGGDGTAQLDDILRVDPATGSSTVAGRLPVVSSDQAAAAIGEAAYIVGGYTGTRWLDTIVRWQPGAAARIVAHLPTPLRYAAVTTVDGKLIIAGGSLPRGTATADVLQFDPATGRVQRIGRLGAPTTHAAAASLRGIAYVIGGRGAAPGTPTARVEAIDPARGTVRPAGRLPAPLSDTAAIALDGRIIVAGGRDVAGTVPTVYQLTQTTTSPPATASALNVYAADGPNMLTGAARQARPLVYVPNAASNTVDVINPATFKVIDHFAVGAEPQHVVPSYDLKTLYVTNDISNSLTPIDPRTGKPGRPISVADPYNMYFTPDGRHAIVVAERLNRLDFRDPHTFALKHSLNVPCSGVDHIDFSADGSYLIASCEFSGQMLKVDVRREKLLGVLTLPDGAQGMPQDVKLSPDGRVFYVADMHANGLWTIAGNRFKVTGFVRTGAGVHGLYPSRDARFMYATNRGEGTISVINFRTGRVVKKWRLPGGGSPDMGGVSDDGRVLWVSGRYNAVVYAINTRNGKLLAKIPVGSSPHGLCVWPQPGRYSLGHTGILR